MKKLTAGLWIIILTMFVGCDRHASHEHSHETHQEASAHETSSNRSHGDRKALAEDSKKELENVFEINERLHLAFFEYQADQVESLAKEMISAIDSIGEPEVSRLLDYSKETLSKIQASAEREENNQNYHLVSMALIHLLHNFEVDAKYKAYSCPMVKMQWVQNTQNLERVHNPFAPEMPHCGEMHH